MGPSDVWTRYHQACDMQALYASQCVNQLLSHDERGARSSAQLSRAASQLAAALLVHAGEDVAGDIDVLRALADQPPRPRLPDPYSGSSEFP